MDNQIIKLKNLSSNLNQILLILKVIETIKDQDVSKIIEKIQKIVDGDVLIALVQSRVSLEEKQKADLEKKIATNFKSVELIFDYKVDHSLIDPLVIKIEDKEYRYTVA